MQRCIRTDEYDLELPLELWRHIFSCMDDDQIIDKIRTRIVSRWWWYKCSLPSITKIGTPIITMFSSLYENKTLTECEKILTVDWYSFLCSLTNIKEIQQPNPFDPPLHEEYLMAHVSNNMFVKNLFRDVCKLQISKHYKPAALRYLPLLTELKLIRCSISTGDFEGFIKGLKELHLIECDSQYLTGEIFKNKFRETLTFLHIECKNNKKLLQGIVNLRKLQILEIIYGSSQIDMDSDDFFNIMNRLPAIMTISISVANPYVISIFLVHELQHVYDKFTFLVINGTKDVTTLKISRK